MDDATKKLYTEFKKDCKIDKTSLDEECVKQSYLYAKWSERLAKAQAALDSVELELTQFKAKAYLKGKKEKRTEKVIDSMYRISTPYSMLNKKKIYLQKKVNLLQSAVYGMMNRKAMINNLVRLHTSDYFNE